MTKQSSVEQQIREILTNPDKVGNLEITWSRVQDGDLDKAVSLISDLFSTQQAQMRDKVKKLHTRCDAGQWVDLEDVLNIMEKKL
jgi:hypothetical protein